MFAAEARELAVVGGGQIVIEEVDRAAGRHVEAAEDVQQSRLSAARRTQDDDELAPVEIEVDRPEGENVDFAHSVGLRQAARAKDRVFLPGCRSRDRVRSSPWPPAT